MNYLYFRNNGEEREKYEVSYDRKALEELQIKIAKNCGELNIVKTECKYCDIPHNDYLHLEYLTDNKKVYHYYTDVHYKISGNKATEWDHYDEYEVDLYYCDYKDYTCPELVRFIDEIIYGEKKAITKIFNGEYKKYSVFPKVKDKLLQLQDEIASCTNEYNIKRQKRLEELNKSYNELSSKSNDIEKQIEKLNNWTKTTRKELLSMDKEHMSKIKELSKRLDYLTSIENQNMNQENLSNYLEEVLSHIHIKLIDKMSLSEIKRVRDFESTEIVTDTKEMKLILK